MISFIFIGTKRGEIMKSKITSFIMTIMMILMIGILIFLALIIYNEFAPDDIQSEVQDFISNITSSSKNVNASEIETVRTPQILEVETDLTNQEEENTNYKNSEIDKYFYNQLNEYSKIIYNAMELNKENMRTGVYEINLGTELSSLLSQNNGEQLLGEYYQSAIEAYTYDNPDVFYIEFSKLYLNIETTTRGIKKTYRVFINAGDQVNYLTDEFPSKENIDNALNEIERVKAYFVQNKRANTYENVKLVHDYLVQSIEYEQTVSMPNIYNLYGAIINKQCVCEGYAKAFKYLMDSIDIPCVIVIGKATNSEGDTENHAWNYVQLNGIWYAIDCTWDDPILTGPGFISNSSKYKYFLKGEVKFNKTHFPNGQFTENGKVFEFPILSQVDY